MKEQTGVVLAAFVKWMLAHSPGSLLAGIKFIYRHKNISAACGGYGRAAMKDPVYAERDNDMRSGGGRKR